LILVHPSDGQPDLTQEPTIRHMLIPLDGTPLAEQIFEPALALGQGMRSDYTLLRVVTPAYVAPIAGEPAVFGSVAGALMERVERMQAALKKEAGSYLDKAAQEVLRRSEG